VSYNGINNKVYRSYLSAMPTSTMFVVLWVGPYVSRNIIVYILSGGYQLIIIK